jgi:hypothetical protein
MIILPSTISLFSYMSTNKLLYWVGGSKSKSKLVVWLDPHTPAGPAFDVAKVLSRLDLEHVLKHGLDIDREAQNKP